MTRPVLNPVRNGAVRCGRSPRITVRAGGFTLIELIVVIVIIGILVGFAVISMNRTAPDSVDACRDQLQLWLSRQAVAANLQGGTVYIDSHNGQPRAFVLSAAAPISPSTTTNRLTNPVANPTVTQASTQASVQPAAQARIAQIATLSQLAWPQGCEIQTVPAAAANTGLNPADPRVNALLAVTANGTWSSPPSLNQGKPELQVRGQQAQTRSIDLAPAPIDETPP